MFVCLLVSVELKVWPDLTWEYSHVSRSVCCRSPSKLDIRKLQSSLTIVQGEGQILMKVAGEKSNAVVRVHGGADARIYGDSLLCAARWR